MAVFRLLTSLDMRTREVYAEANRVHSKTRAVVAEHISRSGRPSEEGIYGRALEELKAMQTMGWLKNPIDEEVLTQNVSAYYNKIWRPQ